MTSRKERLEGIGRAVNEGRGDEIQARVTGHAPVDSQSHLTLESQESVGSDFSEKRLESFHAIGTRFLRCSFRGIQVEDACWGAGKGQSHYIDCCFDGATFRSVAPGNARFVNCSFRDVHVLEFYGFDVELINCAFSGRIDGGFLNGTRERRKLSLFERLFGRTRNQISGNDFSECDFQDFAFRTGVDLGTQKLPVAPHYLYLRDVEAAIRNGRNAVSSWANDETRRLATILLDIMAEDLSAGQKQQFFRLPKLGDFAAVWERLAPILAVQAPNL